MGSHETLWVEDKRISALWHSKFCFHLLDVLPHYAEPWYTMLPKSNSK